MRRTLAFALAVFAAAVFSAGCRTRRAQAPVAPPRPVRVFTPPPPVKPAAIVLAEPEPLQTPASVSALPQPPLPPAVSQYPPFPRPVRRRPAAPAAKPSAEEPATENPAEPAPDVLLGEVLPGGVARQLERQLAENSAAARQVLERIRGRRLSREQAELAARIRGFLRQAGEIRARDLAAAAELSRRASLLAWELEKSLR